MILQDNKGRQVVLEQNPLTNEFSVVVYNKLTRRKITYKNQTRMRKLICECI